MPEEEKMLTEDDVIDFILQTLYAHLHKNELHLERDILGPSGIQMDENQVEHIRELLMTTHLVNNSVGFGKTGYIYLTKQGIALMKKYKSWHAIQAAEQQQNGPTEISSPNPYQRSSTPVNRPAAEEPPREGGDDMAH